MTVSTDILNQQSDSDILISIIMPVYNCEKFIRQALDSLINQDCPEKNYEIVITDDGSTDSTGKICDDYAAKYSFIHVTHTMNMGVSHARNTAMFQCKGEYITFCDGDDEVSPQLISVLTRAVDIYGKPDIIAYSHFKIMPSEGWPVYDIKNMKSSEAELIDSETLIIRTACSWGGYSWNKIFRS
ncbi:MAG: glycosyltransferase family 2 protein, partial [Synergistaceae bacterium]|nr:glycosyltransferase family 2 protein [Synergistaceae bacterium]MBR0069400.1 glycosyltransferase family 2 protein [Synergistaceae bacterium]